MTLSVLTDEQNYAARLKIREESAYGDIWNLLDEVCDPEIPVVSLWDLGVLSNIEKQNSENDSQDEGGTENSPEITVTLTPTYSGCSAMDVMRDDILIALTNNGYKNVKVKTQLSPAWSSKWLSPEGRRKMNEFGIAPPNPEYCAQKEYANKNIPLAIACPHCKSLNTRQISEFGSTACKALHQCNDCLEPFDYFKTI